MSGNKLVHFLAVNDFSSKCRLIESMLDYVAEGSGRDHADALRRAGEAARELVGLDPERARPVLDELFGHCLDVLDERRREVSRNMAAVASMFEGRRAGEAGSGWVVGTQGLAEALGVGRSLVDAHRRLGRHPVICGKAERVPGGNGRGLRWR